MRRYVIIESLADEVIEDVSIEGRWVVLLLKGGKYTSFKSMIGGEDGVYVTDLPIELEGRRRILPA